MKITARVMRSRLLMMISQVVHPLIIRKSWLVMLAVVDMVVAMVVACQVEDAQQQQQNLPGRGRAQGRGRGRGRKLRRLW